MVDKTCPQSMTMDEYDRYISQLRAREYPALGNQLYLDHAGTTLFSKSLMDQFQAEMMSNLWGNPHSASPSSQASGRQIDIIRHQLLAFFGADMSEFDLVFTANATAAIKLVADAFHEQENGFDFGYHVNSHTSLVGVRESAMHHVCLETDKGVIDWLNTPTPAYRMRLLAYPAQSNFTGRRLPLDWLAQDVFARCDTYTLLDAASYASTTALNLSQLERPPDFTAVSLYKIFGFPDLGALIVRKSCGHLFERRRYFGGGTVDMVVCQKEQWRAWKAGSLHSRLEDGTLPIHNILALKAALSTHAELFGTLDRVSRHTSALAEQLYAGLRDLVHGNGRQLCTMYKDADASYADVRTQGPIVTFNLRASDGSWVSNTDVEKVSNANDIHLRTGGLCNPGGIAQALQLEPWELRRNFSAGFRCGSEYDIMNNKPTGVIRLSVGAMSTRKDVRRAIEFFRDFFVEKCTPGPIESQDLMSSQASNFHIETLTIYPVKSCKGWSVPADRRWEVRPEGLLFDREWCIVHCGTNKALSQKQYPVMALVTTTLDLERGVLRITAPGVHGKVEVPLSKDPSQFSSASNEECDTEVCGDAVRVKLYHARTIQSFLTQALGVPCTLARFPSAGLGMASARHTKAHLSSMDAISPSPRTILLSNESPVLMIFRSSLNRLNEQVKERGSRAVHHSVFRANIVVAESPLLRPGQEQPWAEEEWQTLRIISERNDDGGGKYEASATVEMDVLGDCRRCQMICIDQISGVKNPEPFATLAKTRRRAGKVFFGVHTALSLGSQRACAMVRVGDVVEPTRRDQ